MGASKIVNMGASVVYNEQMEDLRKENDVLKGLIGNIVINDYQSTLKENTELKITIARLEERLKAEKNKHESSLKRSQETMQGQKKAVERDYDFLESRYNNLSNNYDKLKKEKEDLNKTIEDKDTKISSLTDNLIVRDEELEILNKVVESVFNVKLDTEKILVEISKLGISVADISLEELIKQINENDGLEVLTKDNAATFKGIVEANKKYLMTSNKGKVVVKNNEDLVEKINIVIDVLDNDGHAGKGIADKYNTSKQALDGKVGRLRTNGLYDIVKEYVQAGNCLTEDIKNKYEAKYPELIEVLDTGFERR